MDNKTTVGSLKQLALQFRDDRNWKQFHDPKNLSAGLSIESAELQEIFLWKSKSEIKELLESEKGRKMVEEEIADIFIFLLYLSEACEIDLSKAVEKKIDINTSKYPIEKSYNSSKKYTEFEG